MLPRNCAAKINALLEVFPAVLILGVRQSGKTTLAKQVRSNWKYFDLENINDHDFITADMDFFLANTPPISSSMKLKNMQIYLSI